MAEIQSKMGTDKKKEENLLGAETNLKFSHVIRIQTFIQTICKPFSQEFYKFYCYERTTICIK